jgi:hypothetical protein
MSSVSTVASPPVAAQPITTPQPKSAAQPKAASTGATPAPGARASDGDTAAQEAAESIASKQAEKLGGGFAPNSSGAVNRIA